MYGNSSASASGSYSLTFLGKKVGRHHSVAPAGKQIAWETSPRSTCAEDPVMPSQAGHNTAVHTLDDLPGSVPELKEERPCPIIHNTQLDAYEDNIAGVSERKVTT